MLQQGSGAANGTACVRAQVRGARACKGAQQQLSREGTVRGLRAQAWLHGGSQHNAQELNMSVGARARQGGVRRW